MNINVSVHFTVTDSDGDTTTRDFSKDFTQSGVSGGNPGVVDIGPDSPIDFGAIVAPGWAWIENKGDDTVRIGPEANGGIVPLLRFPPGVKYPVYLDETVTLRGKSDSGGLVRMLVHAYED